MIILFRFSPHSMKYTCTQHSKKKKILALFTRRSKKIWETLYQPNRFGRNHFTSIMLCILKIIQKRLTWESQCSFMQTAQHLFDNLWHNTTIDQFPQCNFLTHFNSNFQERKLSSDSVAESDPNNGEKRKTWKRD